MAKYVNITTGAKGGYLNGTLVMAEPGEEVELDDAPEEWFAKPTAKAAKEAAKADDKD